MCANACPYLCLSCPLVKGRSYRLGAVQCLPKLTQQTFPSTNTRPDFVCPLRLESAWLPIHLHIHNQIPAS